MKTRSKLTALCAFATAALLGCLSLSSSFAQERVKGSDLPTNTTPLTGSEFIFGVGNAHTYKYSLDDTTGGLGSWFAGKEHGHIIGDVTGLQTALDGKSPVAGNTSLTTVGTISTGTWHGTAIDLNYLAIPSSIGGNGVTDAGQYATFGDQGQLAASSTLQVFASDFTGHITLNSTSLARYQTANGFEGILQFPDLTTAGRTWTLPNATGTLILNNGDGSGLTGLTKAQVGLSNVQNTALTTWAGSTSLTTLGTISTGTWQGAAVADTYIASAAAWNAKLATNGNGSALTALNASALASGTVATARLGTGTADSTTYLRGDGTWSTVSGGATLAANTFTHGQTITQGTANEAILTSTGYNLTGTSAVSFGTFTGTWNTTGTPSFIKAVITDTASNAASLWLDFGTSAGSNFAVTKTGHVWANGGDYNRCFVGTRGTPLQPQVGLGSGNGSFMQFIVDYADQMLIDATNQNLFMNKNLKVAWGAFATVGNGSSVDTSLSRNAAGIIAVQSVLQLPAVAAPGAPSVGFRIYVDSADNKLKAISSAGTVTTLANP